MDATIMLLVKGDEATAREAATRRGFHVTGEARPDGKGCTFIRVRGPAGVTLARAVWWMAEPGEAPFPPGALLWHDDGGAES